ncbi:MAG: AraC family transcriptional regulator, partial [Clostridia bacterium]
MITEVIFPSIQTFIQRICFPGWVLDTYTGKSTQLTYLLAGTGLYQMDRKTYALHAGDLFYAPPGTRVQASSPAEDLMTCYTLSFTLEEGDTSALPLATVSTLGCSPDLLELFSQLDRALLRQDRNDQTYVQALCMLLLHRILAKQAYAFNYYLLDPRIRTAVDYILAHYMESITVQGLATFIGLNPVYFGTLFRVETGVSLKDYLNRIRTNRAETLLASGEYMIHQVASL